MNRRVCISHKLGESVSSVWRGTKTVEQSVVYFGPMRSVGQCVVALLLLSRGLVRPDRSPRLHCVCLHLSRDRMTSRPHDALCLAAVS